MSCDKRLLCTILLLCQTQFLCGFFFFCLFFNNQGDGVNSYYDQKEYIGRSVHYWKVALPLLEKIKNRRSIPEPLDPLFIHFPSKDIQVNNVLISFCIQVVVMFSLRFSP